MKLNTRGYVSGFSLLELLVALAIVAILAGMAWPSYQQWVCQSRRGAAINQLLTLQLRQEAYKVEQGQFSTSLAALGPAS
ncbi:MAG: type IV pilin protein, partial [Aeromonadaceae bacterium]